MSTSNEQSQIQDVLEYVLGSFRGQELAEDGAEEVAKRLAKTQVRQT